ncbi:MAG: DUF2213 domain-containing protein [Lachnospiraceae bacterium]|nr:DUF2213 domain-containing protein [Lachnospiraceae bacterium]MCI9333497.1 DUF2213 domain-containing protein [Lachnospiraceae bacterium]
MDQTYYTEEGYLVDHPIVTRCGIFEYEDPQARDGIRRELRIPEEVFSEKSLASYEGKPIIITHDAGEIDKNNVHREQIGTILSKGYRDGESVRCKIVIHNTDALKRCGLRELSLGYSQTPEEKPGKYQGQSYDCIQRDIEINHLALVGEARAGDAARLNIDHKDGAKKKYLKGGPVMAKVTAKGEAGKKKRYDGDLTPEQIAQAIALFRAQQETAPVTGDEEEVKLDADEVVSAVRERKDRRDSGAEQMDSEAVIAEQEGDIEALLNVIDELQAASDMGTMDGDDTLEGSPNHDEGDPETNTDESEETIDSEDLSEDGGEEEKPVNLDSMDKAVNKKVKEYLEVCRIADKLNLDGVEDLDLTSARKKVIKKVNPKLNLDGKSDAYIRAAYDIAKQEVAGRKRTDDQRRSMSRGRAQNMDSADTSSAAEARKNMISKLGGKK